MSFEQDVLVSSRWWREVFPLIQQSGVAVASGLRFPSDPVLRKLHEYWSSKHFSSLRGDVFTFGMTLDNTVYCADVLRKVGGFPKGFNNVGIDKALAEKLKSEGYVWFVNRDVRSVHIRKGIRDELKHQTWYARNWRQINPALSRLNVFFRFIVSFFSCFPLVWKTREPRLFVVYPAERFCFLKGVLKG